MMADNPTVPETAPGSNDQLQGTQGQGQSAPKMVNLTQEQFDAIIADRLERERKKYGDYEVLKSRAAKLQELEDAQKSDAQKQAERIQALEAQAAQALTARREADLKSVLVSAASKAGFLDPMDAYAMLDKSAITIGDDGTVSGVEDAIKALVEAKPYLLKTPEPAPKTGIITRQVPTGNPSGTSNSQPLEWYKARRGGGGGNGGIFGGGGVIAPD